MEMGEPPLNMALRLRTALLVPNIIGVSIEATRGVFLRGADFESSLTPRAPGMGTRAWLDGIDDGTVTCILVAVCWSGQMQRV